MIRCISLRCINLLVATSIALITAHNSWADNDNFKWHGYLSQGLVHTSDNRFFGDSEDTSWELTDIALGANWRPLARLQLSAQALYRQAGETSRDDVYIDYALVDFTLVQRLSWTMGTRAGRIKNPYGLFNDTRDVAKNRPSILLAESIYRDPIRDIFHTSDSLSLYGHSYLGEHLIQWDLLSGKPIVTDSVEDELITLPIAGKLEEKGIDIARILVESFGGQLRFAYSYTKVKVDFEPNSGVQTLQISPSVFITVPLYGYPGTTQVEGELWSLEYNSQHWQLIAEYQTLDFRVKDIYGPGSRQTSPTLGYYASANYRFNNHWSSFIRHDVYYTDEDDKDGRDYEQQTGMPDHNRFAHDTTIGVRYDINKEWQISMEYHKVRGTAWLSSIENNLAEAEKDWDLFSVLVSYQF